MKGNQSRTQGHFGIALPSKEMAITELKIYVNSSNNEIIFNLIIILL